MTPIEQARLRMPPALPMSLAPRDGTPVLVCAVDYPGRKAFWTQAYYSLAVKRWYTTYAKRLIHDPLGWLPVPEVLTAPVEEMPPVPYGNLIAELQTANQRIELLVRNVAIWYRRWAEARSEADRHQTTDAPTAPERHKPLPYPEEDA